jgi:hypothetical protein
MMRAVAGLSAAFWVAGAVQAQTARDTLQACRRLGSTLTGDVQRLNGQPAPGVRVTMAWAALVTLPRRFALIPCTVETTADSTGTYRFDDINPSGPVVLRADGAQQEVGLAYRQETDLERGEHVRVWMPTVGARPAASPRGACELVGRVVTDDGAPVARAAVRAHPAPAVRTTSAGDFTLPACAASGIMRVEVMGLAVAPFSANVFLPEQTPAVVLTVDRRVPRLDPVLVEADRRLRDWQGFDTRRERGDGTYITRDQIRRRDVPTLTRLLETLPGLRLGDDAQLYVARNAFARCPAAVYLDGLRIDAMRLDAVTVPDILGIEIYRGASDTPAQFTRLGTAGCGTVVIWSRISADTPRRPDS